MSLTREALAADPAFEDEPVDLPDWEPLVAWSEGMRAYTMANTVIQYCPWCGALLPEDTEAALAEAEKTGVFISVDWNGTTTARVDGEAVDAAALLREIGAPVNEA